MAWNEPGGNGRDPWSGKRNDQGPPDLDEVLKSIQKQINSLFGGGKRNSRGDEPPTLGGGGNPGLWGVAAGILIVLWLATGIYIIEPAERGVELRLGAFSDITMPGPHWHIPYPIEDVVKINVDQMSSFPHKAEMLTRDENIVDIELTVQSRIQDPDLYLFQDQSPDKTLRDATETVVREVIGKSDLDYILTQGRGDIAIRIKDGVQALMKLYGTGLLVTTVNMQPAKPPDQVKAAFDDAIKAREDKERLENEAQAYANEIVPKARGEAARRIADATAYRDRVVSAAQGETSRFLAILREYKKAPQVTRERMYVDAMEDVLGRSSKVLVDVKNGNNMMYLPLDRLLAERKSTSPDAVTSSLPANSGSLPRVPESRPSRESVEDRRMR